MKSCSLVQAFLSALEAGTISQPWFSSSVFSRHGALGKLVFQQMGQELTGTVLSTEWWICVFTAKNSV